MENTTMRCLSAALALAAALSACTGAPAPEPAPPGDRPSVTVAERWESPRMPEANLDSVAFWSGGGEDLLLVTAKETDRIEVFDGRTGRWLRRTGAPGSGPGELRRPNGIAALGDLAWVVERDNARVQLFRLPGLEPVGVVGEGTLRRPYGLALFEAAAGDAHELYVTDNYVGPDDEPPAVAQLGERVRHFRVRVDGAPSAELVRSFGDTSGPGMLSKVETIAADPELDRLLVAEELEGDLGIVVYDLGGEFTGKVFGSEVVTAEPEGVALWPCGVVGDGGDGAYWIVTDQHETESWFRVFDRRSLEYVGSFRGRITANTDGVALTAAPFADFPAGAFFAIHDDQSVTAFDLADVARALRLDCRTPMGG